MPTASRPLNERGEGGIIMGLLTMLGYTPLTPHQNARVQVWRDALRYVKDKLPFEVAWGSELGHLDALSLPEPPLGDAA